MTTPTFNEVEFAWVPNPDGAAQNFRVHGRPWDYEPGIVLIDRWRKQWISYVYSQRGAFLGDTPCDSREDAIEFGEEVLGVEPSAWHVRKLPTPMTLNDAAVYLVKNEPR